MKEEARKEILQEAQKAAYLSLQSYMRYQYYFGEEDWDEELPYIEGAYRYRLWTSLLERKPVTQEPGSKRVLEDYQKEKHDYEKTCKACDKKLEKVLVEHNALFEIDIVTFSPESFYGYVTLKDNLGVNSIYPTSLSTVYQDTVTALKGLKIV